MENRFTQEEIRLANRQKIYHHIYHNAKTTSQDICAALSLSRPTVAAYLSALETEGLICRDGLQEAGQVGRRAVVYSIVTDYRIAIGVEVLESRVNILAVNLYGRQIALDRCRLSYSNEPYYYDQLCRRINAFIESLHVKSEQVLGICITLQGLASPDGRTLVYGEIQRNTGLSIEVFEQHLAWPCRFIHDPAAAALAELEVAPEINSVLYLSLSAHLGGAIILDRRIQSGKHGHHATFEHIKAVPDGERCYCGQYGCWDTLCSMPALLGEEEAEDFFRKMREGDAERTERWHTFLTHLARLIRDLHLVNDMDIMIGGHLSPFFQPEDVSFLYREIRQICPFIEADDFIFISKMLSYPIPVGAALHYIHAFLENV